MQFNLKFGKKENTSKIKLLPMLGSFWQKIYKGVLFILLIAAAVFGYYTWNKSLSGKGWSVEKKQEYLKSQNKRIVFREKDFEKVVADIEARKKSSVAENSQEVKDIFKRF
ncbi:MAG: hypothetical protein WCI36_04600 [bacterium]